ncbi:MAG: hemolysin family protein [Geminicoccaceae bacterium]
MNEATAGHGREPRVSLLQTLLGRLRSLARRKNGEGHSLRETLEELIEEDDGDDQQSRSEFSEEERAILLNALSFGELQLWDVMVPRSDITSIDMSASLGLLIDTMRESTHTRLPVSRDNLDEIVGMVHLKDLLPFWGDGDEFKLESILRELMFVPPSMKVLDLLMKMRDTGVHMAIVIDEFGGTDGMVTIEDLVEEIVGEIQDEHDKILPPSLNERPDGVIEADGRVKVEDLEQHLTLELLEADRREDVDTLGGLIFTLLDRVPSRGEIVRHPSGVEFEVLDADPRRVKRLLIRHPAAVKAAEEPSAADTD